MTPKQRAKRYKGGGRYPKLTRSQLLTLVDLLRTCEYVKGALKFDPEDCGDVLESSGLEHVIKDARKIFGFGQGDTLAPLSDWLLFDPEGRKWK